MIDDLHSLPGSAWNQTGPYSLLLSRGKIWPLLVLFALLTDLMYSCTSVANFFIAATGFCCGGSLDVERRYSGSQESDSAEDFICISSFFKDLPFP